MSVGSAPVVDVGAGVEVGATVGVEKSVVLVGAGVLVGKNVGVEKSNVLVGAGVLVGGTTGVRVGTFGTQSSCPA